MLLKKKKKEEEEEEEEEEEIPNSITYRASKSRNKKNNKIKNL